MSFQDKFCPTQRYAHLFNSVERVEDQAQIIDARLVHPIGREAALQQAGAEMKDMLAKALEILSGELRRKGTPEGLAEAHYFTNYYMKLGHGRCR